MSPDLQGFVARCARIPGAITPLKSLWRAFHESLPLDRRAAWSRDRLIQELVSGGFAVGDVDNRSHVAGLTPPGGAWRPEDGRLEFAT